MLLAFVLFLFCCFQGYLPPNIDWREETLQRKRQEYRNFIERYYPMRNDLIHKDTFQQVSTKTRGREGELCGQLEMGWGRGGRGVGQGGG